jgi:DNA-binding transcriptional LysR family regulator
VIAVELRHLRYFVAIAEEGSFMRAAERLWLAQPGLSSQIRRLEAELGIQLFVRHTRGVDLTGAGELFLERARTVLAAADDALALGGDLQAGLVGSVRLGLADEAHAVATPGLLAAFGREHPNVELSVVTSYTGALLRDLRDGRLNAVIAPSAFASAELRSLQIASEPWAVLVADGHRLAEPGPISAEALRGEPIVVTGHRDGAGSDRAVSELLDGLGVSPMLVPGGPGPALHAAVAAGDALALGSAPTGELIARPLTPTRRLRFALMWRDEPPAPALRELIATVQAATAVPHLRVLEAAA